MPYTARYKGEERGAWSVPKDETAYCTECDGPMIVVSKGIDGTARHFRHDIWKAGYSPPGGSGGGQSSSCGGGEDEAHKKWKNFAAERLADIFGDRAASRPSVEFRLAAPWSDKTNRSADACVLFENRDRQLGRGLAVEVQNKNKGKDTHAVAMDYQRQDISVLWLYEDDFNDDGLPMAEIDIRHRVMSDTSICAMCDKWAKVVTERDGSPYLISHVRDLVHTGLDKVHEAVDAEQTESKVSASFPRHWFLPTQREHWQNEGWDAAFHDAGGYKHERMALRALLSTLPKTEQPQATIPEPAADELAYHTDSWHRETIKKEPPRLVFSPTLPFAVVDHLTRDGQKRDSLHVDTPWGPFDDVQCYNCGNYQYAPSAGRHCPTCGTLYDWSWNLSTGRISKSSIPDIVTKHVAPVTKADD